MEIKNKIEDYILILDNMINEATTNVFYEISKNMDDKFHDATIIGDMSGKGKINKNIRDVKNWGLGEDMNCLTGIHWGRFLQKAFQEAFKHYMWKLNVDKMVLGISNITVLKYGKGGHYKFHSDHTHAIPRTLSLIWFINDDYQGGDLNFCTPDFKNEYKVEKKKNRIVIFPSNFLYPHKVSPVTEGTRYSVVSWAL
jgi:hypothetical protein